MLQEDVIVYDGNIDFVGHMIITDLAINKNVRTLRIRSGGGDVFAGIEIGRLVRSRGWNVVVFDYCFSSCANYVFTAGKSKVLEHESIVAWHGGSFQRNFRERLRFLLDKSSSQGKDSLTPAEAAELAGRRRSTTNQAMLYRELGVNEYLTRAGQEPERINGLWTLSTADMEFLGVHDIDAPKNYGQGEYCKSWNAAHGNQRPVHCLALTATHREAASKRVVDEFPELGLP